MTTQQILDAAIKDHQAGRLKEAEAGYRQVIALQPVMPEAHFFLGSALQGMGRFDEAIAAFGKAISLQPKYGQAFNNLGICLRERNKLEESVAAFRQAIAISPEQASPHFNLGCALQMQGRFDEAIAEYQSAARIQPDMIQAYGNLADALREKGDLAAAVEQCGRVLALVPNSPPALTILGTTLVEQEKYTEALAAYDRALAANANYAEAKWSRGVLQMMLGNLREGWEGLEARWHVRALRVPRLTSAQPRWDGSPLNGKRILLNTEQGSGDVIHFIRYAKRIAGERSGRVVLDCLPPLERLLRSVEGIDEVVPRGKTLPQFDVHFPLMSVPWAFGTTRETIPADVPYMRADSADVERWRDRLAALDDRRLKVGLVWSGSPVHTNDRNRSISLQTLAPLGQLSGRAQFFSLQKGPAAAQATSLPPGLQLVDWTPDLNDFADTAALVMNLDLVICVDTSVAHLAGALGKQVWILLPKAPDYRWLLNRSDSPWYPTMRLFRQTVARDWAAPLGQIVQQLKVLAESR